MNRNALIQKIKAKAKQDTKNRRDPRFLTTMGFLVAKGFLKTNFKVPLLPNKRIRIEDAIWAGEHVEPRILEVIPAAVLRLKKHFMLDPMKHKKLIQIMDQLRRREKTGEVFYGMSYKKIKLWAEIPLLDKRVKSISKKKVVKTFRLDPSAVECLERAARAKNGTVTKFLEELLFGCLVGYQIISNS